MHSIRYAVNDLKDSEELVEVLCKLWSLTRYTLHADTHKGKASFFGSTRDDYLVVNILIKLL